MSIYCPYCAHEIKPDDIHCPSCSASYGLETLLLIRGLVKETIQNCPSEKREYDRVRKKFKIVYQNRETLTKSYLANIGRGGIFIPTQSPLSRKEKFSLNLLLPDGGGGVSVLCEVAWSRKEERVTPQGKYSRGMGVRFLNLSSEDRERINRILRQAPTP